MMKIISIIKSFLFGDTDEEHTQTSTVREENEIEENSLYIPPMDNTTIFDKPEYILDTPSNCFEVFNVEDNAQTSTLVESQSDVKKTNEQIQDDSFPLNYQLKNRNTSTIKSTQLQETDFITPKVEKDTIKTDINLSSIDKELLIKSFTELIKELDIVLNKSEDENSRQIIKFCQSRIIEILSNNGVESMKNDSIFDSTRHIPVPFRIIPKGTLITNVERNGLIYFGKVILKAQVNV